MKYSFEIQQMDEIQASGSSNSAKNVLREMQHYALVYGQDGAVTIKLFEFDRLITLDELELLALKEREK